MNNIYNLVNLELKEIVKSINIDKKSIINKDINDFLQSPSKHIRSVISLLYIKSFCSKIKSDVIHLLIAIELLHNASLLHDDVIDNSSFRRGNTTLNQKYSSKISVLAGNVVLTRALQELLKITNYNNMIDEFLICTNQMCEAEFKQFFSRGNIPTLEEYTTICKGKTATLFMLALKLSARIMQIDENIASDFGENFGILFQIQNDLDQKSAQEDDKNRIFTALKILGVEKTDILIDNYINNLRRIIKELPKNEYSKALEDLVNKYGKSK